MCHLVVAARNLEGTIGASPSQSFIAKIWKTNLLQVGEFIDILSSQSGQSLNT